LTDEKSDVFGRKRYMERYIGVMEQSSEYREQLLESYKQAVRPLLPYLPWLEQSAGKRASSIYSGQDIGVNSVSFPVYDGTLLNFVREATKSPLMDRNYAYVYTRHRIRTHQEERDIIQKAGWKEWDILRGILSKYVLGGRTKGNLWSEAVSERIFYLVRELEVMSYSDPLTTLGNRYAMERYIEQVDHTEPIGVVYCDITGLKRINDSEGHSAGDRLIRRCCDCLKRVFEGNGMFRIGGDELVVLCTGISEKEFYQKVEELKTELAAHDVSMAVGAAVNTLEAVGKDHLLTESERRMYQDKAEYYRSTGLDRRKI
jgi:diguanylate cyclase (GGDEF)-like protein